MLTIRWMLVTQGPREFVITFPRSYHGGFNMGECSCVEQCVLSLPLCPHLVFLRPPLQPSCCQDAPPPAASSWESSLLDASSPGCACRLQLC